MQNKTQRTYAGTTQFKAKGTKRESKYNCPRLSTQRIVRTWLRSNRRCRAFRATRTSWQEVWDLSMGTASVPSGGKSFGLIFIIFVVYGNGYTKLILQDLMPWREIFFLKAFKEGSETDKWQRPRVNQLSQYFCVGYGVELSPFSFISDDISVDMNGHIPITLHLTTPTIDSKQEVDQVGVWITAHSDQKKFGKKINIYLYFYVITSYLDATKHELEHKKSQ